MIETQTIDITYVRKVLSHCPNYDEIINYEYDDGDNLTSKLIDWYRELIFSVSCNDENQLKILELLDKSLFLYINNNKYKKGLKKIISIEEIDVSNNSLIKEVVKKIVLFTNKFEDDIILDVDNTMWL